MYLLVIILMVKTKEFNGSAKGVTIWRNELLPLTLKGRIVSKTNASQLSWVHLL